MPMIVRYPGKVSPSTTSETPWYFADVLPTMLDLIDQAAPDNVDGVSLLPTILGKEQDLSERFMYWEKHNGGLHQAVRWGKWKVVRSTKDVPLELYDLEQDREEKNNIADSHAEIVAKIEE